MSYPAVIHGSFADQFATTATQILQLGIRMFLPDGRRYAYCEMGGTTAGVVGSIYESEAVTANWNNENATVVAAQYATEVTVDVASTVGAVDIFKDGFLVDETNGHIYSIAANTLADPTVLTLNDPLETDIATGDVLSMFKSPFKDVVAKVAAEPAAPIVGVCTKIIAVNEYGWLQTYGLCGVLVEDVIVVGDKVVASVLNDAGACEAATDDLGQVLGNVLEIGANTEIGAIFLTIG